MKHSTLEELLAFQLNLIDLPFDVTREYRVSREVVGNEAGIRARLVEAGLSDWVLDFAWLPIKFSIEVQGGTWKKLGHSSGKGIQRDCTKMQQCALMGWTVIPVTGDDVRSGKALKFIENYLKEKVDT